MIEQALGASHLRHSLQKKLSIPSSCGSGGWGEVFGMTAPLDQSLVPLAPATFFSTLNGYLFVESDPQATGTDFLSSPGTHCSVLELESGSCGVGLGSMVF